MCRPLMLKILINSILAAISLIGAYYMYCYVMYAIESLTH
jgi:hypothetical protein